MFKGGSGSDETNDTGPHLASLRSLEDALAGDGPAPEAIEHQPAPAIEVPVPTGPVVDEDKLAAAMSLIEGQGGRKRRGDEAARDRQLSTGSETDIALRPESEPDEVEAEFEEVGPDDLPPRRSRQ